MFDVVTLGNALIDAFLMIHDANIHCHVNKKDCELCVKYGEKIALDSYELQLGGNACNVAVGLQRLGLPTAIIAEIGGDELSHTISHGIEEQGVSTEYLKKTDGQSSFAVGLQFQGERTLFVNHVSRDHVFQFANLHSKWLYLTSLGNEWRTAYRDAVAFVNKNNVHLAFNPGTPQLQTGRESFLDALSVTDILFLNKEEAEEIVGIQSDMKSLLEDLQTLGAKTVVITDGENGSYSLDTEGKTYFCPRVAAPVIEKTGAGDAYATGFLAAIIERNDVEKAMQWGTLNAASVIGKVGAQQGLLTRKVMDEQIKTIYH